MLMKITANFLRVRRLFFYVYNVTDYKNHKNYDKSFLFHSITPLILRGQMPSENQRANRLPFKVYLIPKELYHIMSYIATKTAF